MLNSASIWPATSKPTSKPPATDGVSRARACAGCSLSSPLPAPHSAQIPSSPGPGCSLPLASAAARRRGDPRPERFVEPDLHPLREALEQIPHRVVGGKAFHPQQHVQGPVRPQQRGVRPARRDRAPASDEIRKAVNVSPGWMAFGDSRCTGRCSLTCFR